MITVLERRKMDLERAKIELGSDSPLVKDLQEQINAYEISPPSAEQTYIMGEDNPGTAIHQMKMSSQVLSQQSI